MSELLAEYTRDRFPYSGILEDLTEEARTEQLSPVEAYVRFVDMRDDARLSPHFDYGSTSITTGGHALYMDGIGEVIQANTRTAREMVTLLDEQGSIHGPRMVLPVDMGKTGWTQSEFMTYWGLTIAGPEIRHLGGGGYDSAMGFEHRLNRELGRNGTDTTVMDDSRIPREDRRPHYEAFISAFATAVRTGRGQCLPAYRLVSLVDPDISLGCWAENKLARSLDIPRERVVPVNAGTVDEAVPFPRLREDMKIIMAAGGTVCVAARGSMLTLISEDKMATYAEPDLEPDLDQAAL